MKPSPSNSLTLLKETLTTFLQKGYTADRALNDTFRRHKLKDERVRGELARRFYGVVRYWRPLVTALGQDEFVSVNDIKLLVETWHKWKRIYKSGGAPSGEGPVSERLVKYSRIRKCGSRIPTGSMRWRSRSSAKKRGMRLRRR